MNIYKIAELFIEKIRRDYQNDISLVVVMGSYVYNDTHDKSDLDLYFVPKTKRGYNLGFTFILNDIGFDLWPISWERLERIASHDERITSIITEGKVLYYSSAEDLERFDELKAKALDTTDKSLFTKKSKEVFSKSYELIYRIQEAKNLGQLRRYGIQFINNIGYALALLNGTTIKRGRSKLKQELLSNQLVPRNFSALYDTLFISNDMEAIKHDLLELMKNTEELIDIELSRYQNRGSASDVLSGFFEELISSYNKIEHAYEIDDPVTCLFAGCEIQNEIDDILQYADLENPDFPNIAMSFDPENLQQIVNVSQAHKKQFTDFLKENNVSIRRFENLEEYDRHLTTL